VLKGLNGSWQAVFAANLYIVDQRTAHSR